MRRVLLLSAVCLGVYGCGGQPTGSTLPDAKLHIMRMARLYQQYSMQAAAKSQQRNENGFKQFLSTVGKESLEGLQANTGLDLLVSPRDKEPYVINWNAPSMMEGMKAMSKGGAAGGPIGTAWVAHEKTGVDGKRYVATAYGDAVEVDDEGFRKMVPQ
jgi:hypothetical protein